MKYAALLILAMGACAAPGPEVVSMEGDFGLIEITVAS